MTGRHAHARPHLAAAHRWLSEQDVALEVGRPMNPLRYLASLSSLCCLVLLSVTGITARPFASFGVGSPAQPEITSSGTSPITFPVPTVLDPIHTNGEPDIGIDPQGRVFVSGPTGTGTQRSTWFGSVDGGQTFRVISPGPPPSALAGLTDPPGGGDTDINFDRSGKQYFSDLYRSEE